ncbi:5'-nucleotidase C-terminal domain-containing protein [Paenibacillus shunpengii]|uniref:5'-nucleotidase C-terminal domain-containing protein n=1 Tax=Paenibacillus shunpengii TaxID=2054424 RepID=A0ABW5SJK3_9BACL|nr:MULTISPECIES: 5'-nucleotidase C-terminal domain-containing protein [unclassified Paenibacillus]OMC71962.1 multifunctional 2',3'-cyclic-nucleotide 2'-phosphodiesterase/5'-nucleotidase/3'-nucleotidase [Paenibacillus sp. FSL H7-0326]SDX32105.1 2',3'-cyclic-nucleotide 2'-phosphodiesterase/5'-or 3'-nucleotidase, 5'-nucleotidase family [Paenibacillus sp. PDC88]
MFKWKTAISSAAAAALLFSSLGLASAASETTGSVSTPNNSGTHITLLHTNDSHARAVESSPNMGYAKVAGIFDKYRAENPNTLFLDAGDAVHGTTFATLVNGESIIKVMNEMGYDAFVPGNHEFNYGWEHLVTLTDKLNFPTISANVRLKSDGTSLYEPYIIKEVDGVKIGIIGLTTPETAYKTNPKNVDDIDFTDPSDEAQKYVDEIRDEVDVVVMLAHIGQDDSDMDNTFDILDEVDGIDIYIDGHSHTVLEDGFVADNGTLVASAGEYTNYVGVVDLWVDEGKVVSKKATLIDETEAAGIAPNEKVAALVASVTEEQAPILDEVVATISTDLEGTREKVRAGETNLGDLIADALREVSGADIALTNGGGIRASIEKGEVTKGEVITVLPFGNQIVTLNVKGEDVIAALENGVKSYPEASGGFPQISGFSFKIDPAKEPGSRVHSVMVGNEPIDPEATYTLATNDFTAIGGDEYEMFTKYAQAGMYGSLDEALITHLQKLGSAAVTTDGRIAEAAAPTVTTPVEETPAPEAPVEEEQPDTTTKPTKPTKPTTPSVEKPKVYVVKSGDTLYSISKKHGTTWQTIQKLNKIKNAHWIYPGQTLKLPSAS